MASIVIPAILWSSGASYSVLFAGLSGGLPKQDGDQWTLFDNESLGVSPFAEQVHYARAVETALAHTVRDVDGMISATVKLALPKESDFLTDAPKPRAAVMIRLRPGVQLTTAQIDGVVGLVAAGVPGLSRDNVTLVDQSGKVLNTDDKDGLQQVPRQMEIAQAVAHQYETTITDLLVPVLGRGNFRVSADADIDFSHWQESSVKYGDSHILSEDAASHSRGPIANRRLGSRAPCRTGRPKRQPSRPAPLLGKMALLRHQPQCRMQASRKSRPRSRSRTPIARPTTTSIGRYDRSSIRHGSCGQSISCPSQQPFA